MGDYNGIQTMSAFPATVVTLASCVAAFTDVRQFKVYNLLTFPLLFGGLIYHTAIAGTEGFQESMAGMLFGFGLLIFPYMLGALGAGDVKFVAAVGAWLGMGPMLLILVIGGIATGVYAVCLMVVHNSYREAWANLRLVFFRLSSIGRQFGVDDNVESVQSVAKQVARRQRLIPFSAMITVGVIITIIWNTWVR